jgi:Zn-dependent membrane protease YugP
VAHRSYAAAADDKTGACAAQAVFRAAGLSDDSVQLVDGDLADYYHARSRTLRLSCASFLGRSFRAKGTAIHESGHALQRASGNRWLWARNVLAPVAPLGSGLFWISVSAGYCWGVIDLFLFSIAILWLNLGLQAIILPIEIDASRRAWASLMGTDSWTSPDPARQKAAVDAAAFRGLAEALIGAFLLVFDLVRRTAGFGSRSARLGSETGGQPLAGG